jgi:heterodisulfide reductase subunit A2
VERSSEVLVIGAGVAGMKASLMLASAGRKVHLVEGSSMTGGRIIRCEDVYPSMECATCMVSPLQQELLSSPLISLLTLSEVTSVEGSRGDFTVKVLQRASSVDREACIGCAECWGVCPVSGKNEFEEDLCERKAISVPCAGALPNVPWIDRGLCLRWTEGSDCSLCSDSCVFGALDFTASDRTLDLRVGEIVVATGFGVSRTAPPGIEGHPAVVSTVQIERMFASNGPTEGMIQTLDGRSPSSVTLLVHPFGGIPSTVSTMTALKLLHYFAKRLPGAEVRILLDDAYRPCSTEDPYHAAWTGEGIPAVTVFSGMPSFTAGSGGGIAVTFGESPGMASGFETELLVLAAEMIPEAGAGALTARLGLETGPDGRPARPEPTDPTRSSRPGVFLAGAVTGRRDVATSVSMAAAAVGRVLSDQERGPA